ncbi:CobQ/CobB/MinD/ParA nucleotide binding domain-containing protein [Natronincola ferrireducens]|uniref:CobQ/CobB/MinD/ParA nucleotide binding domain-containing protein n=2 Tax=Natronincola ferrireducens TaxID=393762 RepID=A0A1G8ZW80_9FIRM|nr:CobQ/CobB/MinD/ParA nucleotide binding domain-containing protein [Natronincola ferrireducens]
MMKVVDNKSKDASKGCIITTGVSSLNYYNNYMQRFNEDNDALYNLMGISNVVNIDKADYYRIIIDLSDNSIKDIVFELFNHLLPLGVDINVKLIKDAALISHDTQLCIELLQRLDNNKLIKLEIINKEAKRLKEEEESSLFKKIKNLFIFIGPGNTGKTSILSALTESCNDKGKRIGLIDFTEDCKLMTYFPNIYSLNHFHSRKRNYQEKSPMKSKDLVDVYRCSSEYVKTPEGLKNLSAGLREFTKTYDYVFVNTDMKTLDSGRELFKMAQKIFIVHDFIPTKINITKHILITFGEIGIHDNSTIALIYNKIINCAFNLKTIEEKLIFEKLSNKKLIPLVDLNSKTFEIPYSKKTMGAIINNISTKSSIINNVAYSYRRNIEYLYKYINDIPYVELEEMSIGDYLKECFHRVLQHHCFKDTYKALYKYAGNFSMFRQSNRIMGTLRFLQK